jgi:Tfp pilus assembly protein PilF
MASASLTGQGDCLQALGRLDEAAKAYEENIRRAEKLEDARQVAVGKFQLGSVRVHQRRYPEALAAYEEARKIFENLGEPASMATAQHQIGMVHQDAGQPEAAERAYRESLAIKVQLGDIAGQASTLGQLGNLYQYVLGRLEEAAAFYRQAADKYVQIGDTAGEGHVRNNLANTLRKLGRYGEARQETARRSPAPNPSAMPPNRGRRGPSSPTSNWLRASKQPLLRLTRRPSSYSWPTAATAARTTNLAVGCAPPSPRRCWPATSRRLPACSPSCEAG